jgi:predicted O-methyltransferase YrrM
MDFTCVSKKYEDVSETIEKHVKALEEIIKGTGVPLEGNSFYYHNSLRRFDQLLMKQINLFWAGQQVKNNIIEIGFNAGHSSLLFLLAAEGRHVDMTVFDLGAHAYVRPCLEYLRSQFSNANIKYIEGDSMKTLPEFKKTNPGSYNVVHVDGGHDRDVVLSDIAVTADLVAPGGLFIIDDTNIDYISEIADACISSGAFVEEKILDTVGYQHRILRRV